MVGILRNNPEQRINRVLGSVPSWSWVQRNVSKGPRAQTTWILRVDISDRVWERSAFERSSANGSTVAIDPGAELATHGGFTVQLSVCCPKTQRDEAPLQF